MKLLLSGLVFCFALLASGQGHDLKPADGLKSVDFLKGEWVGKQNFDTGGAPMVAEVNARFQDAIGGRYIEESLFVTVPGRKPSDTRHFLTFDAKANLYKAWWFNDSSVGAMELEGTLTGNKLVLMSKPAATGAGPATVFRATYEKLVDGKLTYMLEMKNGEEWRRLFMTTYTKKSAAK
jgi:hypothetical protein